ncbi:cobalt transporter [Intrasporangium chromatireducens Q5-1]|uniref:Cobalt transporter n=1 Tax=Intrasporangium chromatireducens Q5-1 TaxID=584657 RepID=W9GK75_9MICO|nr:cation diffusion facilitator family transporter [Intrasporangium chromatireducens]EWT06656.1 cobalt transporter [Intrasporangium chromatireducens Q5-1]
MDSGLVADGVHARTDGFTSLAVVAGGIGVLLGFPLADPIVGLLISAMIAVLLIGTIRSVGRRLMDGIEPELVDRAEHALGHLAEVASVERVRLRWVGHRLHGDAVIRAGAMSLAEADRVAAEAEASVKKHLPNVDEMAVRVTASTTR